MIGLAIAVGLVALWPGDPPDLDLSTFGFADEVIAAEVVEVVEGPCSYASDLDCSLVVFELQEGDGAGEMVTQEFTTDPGQPVFDVGDTAFLSAIEYEDGSISYQYADRDRRLVLGGLALLFAVAVVALGRLRGLAALAGLAISLFILLEFIIPAIISGRDAVLVALVGGGAITLVALYLAHGFNPLTHVAALGAFAALALTTVLSWLSVELAQFSGLVEDEAFYLIGIPGVDLRGLLLAGIVLGSLGALDDVTVTQASAVWEVRNANPGLGAADLFTSGLRVGRDHIASTVNTLLLAYAGASMPLLILFALSQQPLAIVANSEVVAIEIARTLIGSIGLVAAVPATTWLGARVAASQPQRSERTD